MRTTTGGAVRSTSRFTITNTAAEAVVSPSLLLRAAGMAFGLALAVAVAASASGCAGGGGNASAANDGGQTGTPLAADEQGMNKAAKDVAEMFEKKRAAEAGRRPSTSDRATGAAGGGSLVPPIGDVGPVTLRDPAGTATPGSSGAMQAGARDAGPGRGFASNGASGGAGGEGAFDGNRPGRAEANMPMSLDGNGNGVGRGRTSEAAQIVRTRLLTEHTRELAVLLEQEAMAPVVGKGIGRRAGDLGGIGGNSSGGSVADGAGSSGGTLVSSAMVLAALAPIDPSAAERYSTLRNRLDEDQLHIADTVRRIVEVSRGPDFRPAEGRNADGKITNSKAQPSNSLTVPKASVAIAGSGVSVLSQVVLDSAITLDEQRGLRIGALALTSAVESFGRYTPMDTSRFVAGRKVPILVYSELANFSNTFGDAGLDDNADGKFSVMLVQSIELRSEADGTVALDYGTQEFSSRARAARRDLFVTRRIELPANLTIGTYVLNVRVRDRATGSETESKLKLEVGAR